MKSNNRRCLLKSFLSATPLVLLTKVNFLSLLKRPSPSEFYTHTIIGYPVIKSGLVFSNVTEFFSSYGTTIGHKLSRKLIEEQYIVSKKVLLTEDKKGICISTTYKNYQSYIKAQEAFIKLTKFESENLPREKQIRYISKQKENILA